MRPAGIVPAEGPSDAHLFRPEPVLAVGLAIDPDCDRSDAETARLAAAAIAVLGALREGCGRIVARDPDLFAASRPRLRLVTRLDGAAEAAVADAASREGSEIGAIRLAASASAPGLASLRLPSSPDAPRDRARTGEVLLGASDILLAIWNGRPDARPGSAGALVSEAVERGMPVLLLPGMPGEAAALLDDPQDDLLPEEASWLPRIPLPDHLDGVLARAFAPPAAQEDRTALRTFLAEPAAPRTRRPEYRALLLLAGTPPAPTSTKPTISSDEEWLRARAVAALVSPAAEAAVACAAARHARIERLAAFHGERSRAGVVLRYSGPAFGALAIAILNAIKPEWGLAWLGVQAVVMTLTIVEATFAARGRWNERWLDYRTLAERLRCDRFLAPFGIGLSRFETDRDDPAWTRWCHRRLARERWPEGEVGEGAVAAAFRHLAEVEIAGQARYHSGAARRFRSLERRLRLISTGSVVTIVLATLVLSGLTLAHSEIPLVLGLVMLLLITLPSVFLASRGLRLEGAFDLAAARSEQALAALRRLEGLIPAGPPTYDRLVQASRRAAAAMLGETVDWRVGQQRSRTPYRGGQPIPDPPREAGSN